PRVCSDAPSPFAQALPTLKGAPCGAADAEDPRKPQAQVAPSQRTDSMSHQALLIAGHGSRDPDGIAEFLDLARHFRAARPDLPVEISFLEFARPTIQEGIDGLCQRGVRTIVVVPGVLMAAGHAKNDMASEVRR